MTDDIASWILYQDDALLVVNKPAGLPTLPDGYHPDAPHLVGVLKQVYAPLWVVHRLDKETSGVIVFACSAVAHRRLNAQFEQRETSKAYHALVVGNPDWQRLAVNLPLRVDGDRRHRTIIDAQRGKPAMTGLQVLERFAGCALVEAIPHTGRTHQIRAHLAAQGCPILGDELYGAKLDSQPVSIERVALHAWSLEFVHPTNGKHQRFEAPYPDDFAAALKQARGG